MNFSFLLSASSLIAVGVGEIHATPAQEPWRSTVLVSDLKDAPAYYNSQRLVLNRRGHPSVIYVKRKGTEEDTLGYARRLGTQWRHEEIYTMKHSGKAPSGISAYALAMDRRDRPHVYLYTADYAKTGSIFEERWAYWDGRWKMRMIRHSKDSLGGAALHDANLAIDLQGNLNVTGYAHNAYGTAHRVRLRYYDGSSFHADPFPRPGGKQDSKAANLLVDGRNTLHFSYGARKAYRRGNAEPGYPDTGLVYMTRTGARWSAPEFIRRRVGPDPNDTGYFVLSTGINLDRFGEPHVTYAISKRGKSEPTYILYAFRTGGSWQQQQVAVVPAEDSGSVSVAVSSPTIDVAGDPHLAYDTLRGTTYVYRRGDDWISVELEGDLQGFAVDPRTGVHVLCSSGPTLTYHLRPKP